MKIFGPLSPDVAQMLGTCEVCGEQAREIVQDFFEIIPFSLSEAIEVERNGMHRFCNEHTRESKFIELREGPDMYLARKSKP